MVTDLSPVEGKEQAVHSLGHQRAQSEMAKKKNSEQNAAEAGKGNRLVSLSPLSLAFCSQGTLQATLLPEYPFPSLFHVQCTIIKGRKKE